MSYVMATYWNCLYKKKKKKKSILNNRTLNQNALKLIKSGVNFYSFHQCEQKSFKKMKIMNINIFAVMIVIKKK